MTADHQIFPIDMSGYRPITLDLSVPSLSEEDHSQLKKNVQLARDAIVFFTAYAGAKGLGGHTGGAYDITPEMIFADSFRRHDKNHIYPVIFDEAGHRVAVHYLMAAVNGDLPFEKLLQYREPYLHLPGHPEKGETPGIEFSSGRLGHIWSFVNGIAAAYPDQHVLMMGSDGSQQEGGDAEAARFAVAHNLNVKLFIDDNDMTITGKPTEYMPGFDIQKTLNGHNIPVQVCHDPENIRELYQMMVSVLTTTGPQAVICKRFMAVGIPGIENTSKGHDVIPTVAAITYLSARGYQKAVDMLESVEKRTNPYTYIGSGPELKKPRDHFGEVVCDILTEMTPEERVAQIRVVDNDLAGSCGIHHVEKRFPEVYVRGGIMERNNFSVCAGFGSTQNRQGITATFSAFLEMLPSEITMARLNGANVLAHFSHAGVDWMADNTCHFGINNFFADNGILEKDQTRLYFPADNHQMGAVVREIFPQKGLRFIFSTRSPTPFILKEDGTHFFGSDGGYTFNPGMDDLIREGTAGYIVTYGEMLYKCLDVVERLRQEGIHVGLINKATLNVKDGAMLTKIGQSPFVLVVESQNYKTGLGVRFGTWLLEDGYHPLYHHLGVTKLGITGIWEQLDHQGLNPSNIMKVVRDLLSKN